MRSNISRRNVHTNYDNDRVKFVFSVFSSTVNIDL